MPEGAAAGSAREPTLDAPGGAHARLRDAVRELGELEVEAQAERGDRSATLNLGLLRRAGALGLLGLTVPASEGGRGLDATAAVIAHHQLARHDPGFALAFLAHTVLFASNLCRAASAEQRARVLPQVLRGDWIGAMAMTEPGGGTDVLGMRTTAERRGSDYVLRGRKTFITNAPDARCFFVYAKIDGEITAFLVERDAPGLAVGRPIDKMGMRAAPMAELVFDGCLVPESGLLGRERGGLVHMVRNLELERLCLAAIAVGIADRCVDEMRRTLAAEGAAGDALRDDGQVQRHFAESYATAEAARSLLYAQAARSSGAGPNWLGADAAKLFAGPAAKRVADRALQVLAIAGSRATATVERLLRDAKLMEIGGGTLEAHHRNVVRELEKRVRGRSGATPVAGSPA